MESCTENIRLVDWGSDIEVDGVNKLRVYGQVIKGSGFNWVPIHGLDLYSLLGMSVLG